MKTFIACLRRALAVLALGGGVLLAQVTDQFGLTVGERAWLEQHQPIRVGYDPGWPPISFKGSRG